MTAVHQKVSQIYSYTQHHDLCVHSIFHTAQREHLHTHTKISHTYMNIQTSIQGTIFRIMTSV